MTMTLIETKTLTSNTASMEFTSIPQTFTDLVLLISARTENNNGTLEVYFNTDTTNSNYTNLRFAGDGSNPYSELNNNPYFSVSTRNNQTSNTFSSSRIYITNYTSSVAKSISSDATPENNGTSADSMFISGRWTGTVAVNRIFIRPILAANLSSGTTMSLYGILRGSSGGVVVS